MAELIADSELTVRVVNPDNKAELLQLVSLIERALRSDCGSATGDLPQGVHPAVSNPRFVRACLSSKFISLVVCFEGRPIAHVAYAYAGCPKVQLHLGVLDPDFAELRSDVEARLVSTLSSEASRKGWNGFELQRLDSPCALTLSGLQTLESSSYPEAAELTPPAMGTRPI